MVEIYVRNFLNSCGLFFYQGFSSLNWLNPLVKKTLINQLLQDCLKKIKNLPKCLKKDIFKKSFEQEIYLLKRLPNYFTI